MAKTDNPTTITLELSETARQKIAADFEAYFDGETEGELLELNLAAAALLEDFSGRAIDEALARMQLLLEGQEQAAA